MAGYLYKVAGRFIKNEDRLNMDELEESYGDLGKIQYLDEGHFFYGETSKELMDTSTPKRLDLIDLKVSKEFLGLGEAQCAAIPEAIQEDLTPFGVYLIVSEE